MISIDVRHNLREQAEKMNKLATELHNQAVAMALNKTVVKGRTEMTRAITSEFAIKSSEVRPLLVVSKAKRNGLDLKVVLEAFPKRRGHRSRNVMLFGARQTAKGVSVKIKKHGGRKIIEHAFIGNQGRTVFMRLGKKRLPIRAVETIDVPQMFNTKRINERVVKRIQAEFPVELARAVNLLISRHWGAR